MLKPYHVRQSDAETEKYKSKSVALVAVEVEKDFELPQCSRRLNNSQVLNNLDDKLDCLSPEQRTDMTDLICEYKSLFSDVPGKTDLLSHDVRRCRDIYTY